MSDETFKTVCRPHTFRQIRECTTQGTEDNPHWVHRELTDLVHYVCNCGYSSGWVPAATMPLPSDFIEQHMPSEGFLQHEETMTRMKLGCTCGE